MGFLKRKGFSLFLLVFLSLLPVSSVAAFSGSGAGTEGDPYIITTADQLNEVRNDLNAHYRLGADIDLDVSPYNEGQGWISIGDTVDPFIGTFDGNWHIIRNLFTTGGNYDYIGLFGVLGDPQDLADPFLVKNLLLEDVDVGSPYFSGGLAGLTFEGTVENCGVIGSVSGFTHVGGLIGAVSSQTTIRRCFMKGSVSGSFTVGGLVGNAEYAASILNSYALADVGAGNSDCGGLLGYGTEMSVGNCYAAGLVTAPSFVGGLVGRNGDGLVVAGSYYDEDVAGVSDNGWGIPRSTSEMKTRSTFSGWDFDVVWAIGPGVNDGYPYLQWEENFAGADGGGGCSTGVPAPLFGFLLVPLALLRRKA
ncbi:MAG: GLUG motif-containing protein [Synergistales bacterium]|jgi:Synergist-CTERM protein sorting domain-containing protein